MTSTITRPSPPFQLPAGRNRVGVAARLATAVWLVVSALSVAVWAVIAILSVSIVVPWFLFTVAGGAAVVGVLHLIARVRPASQDVTARSRR